MPIPLGSFEGSVHFTQFPIFVAAILAGLAGGLITGAAGGLLMSFAVSPKIPFIVGGLAILGGSAGLFAKRLRPIFAGILAWLVQAPYVAVTDYLWFTSFLPNKMPPQVAWALVTTILVILTIEALISAALAEIIITYLKKAKITL